jgi:uncharacterized protein YbcI
VWRCGKILRDDTLGNLYFRPVATDGHAPKSVSVVLTLHDALSPAEQAMAQSPEGAAKVQEFHRQLFFSVADTLRQEIKRITGAEVREARAEVKPTSGVVVQVFSTGMMVMFLLAKALPCEPSPNIYNEQVEAK